MNIIPEALFRCNEAERATIVRSLPEWQAQAANGAFAEWAHEGQVAPEGDDWRTWVLMAGRGFGKTRAGAEWVLSLVRLGMSGRADTPRRSLCQTAVPTATPATQ